MGENNVAKLAWRFLGFDSAPGAWQMAADLHLFRTIDRHPEPLIVRLYRFQPPAVSVGYHQDPEKVVDVRACALQGIDVVRRPTGGRALLHRNEINYAVVADMTRATIFGSQLSEAFERVSSAVAAGLSRLGLEVVVSAGGHGHTGGIHASAGALCAASTTRYEVTCRGRKVAAAAQLRSAGKLLQHGMIYIDESAPMPGEIFLRYGTTYGKEKSLSVMASLRDLLDLTPDLENVVKMLNEGFRDIFGVNCLRNEFQPVERDRIYEMLANTHGTFGRFSEFFGNLRE